MLKRAGAGPDIVYAVEHHTREEDPNDPIELRLLRKADSTY